MQRFLSIMLTAAAVSAVAASAPKPEDTWPGFRGHAMSGVARSSRIPERWSATQGVKWAVPVAGNGWSSPIVWGDTVFVTSAISRKPFKKPTPGLYGNEYIAELRAQGLSNEEISRRSYERDNESAEEATEVRYVVYALDA